ncbi:MAG: DNA polymerase ligase N-terminal domain-containing protein, partial [Candidatus Eremiobacterota bacterium]
MLEEYGRKRDFERTPEPGPNVPADRSGPLAFAVHLHRARQLHYDLRLELHGALASWAVPKGPPLEEGVRRLAVRVEDHPLDYGTFEGNIPGGEYGAGPVIVWDAGTFSPCHEGIFSWTDAAEATRRLDEDMQRGRVLVHLRGIRLKGRFSLVRTPRGWLWSRSRGASWCLQGDRSVLSGRSLDEVDSQAPRVWPVPQLVPGARTAPMRPMRPMLAQTAPAPFSHPDWCFEPKLDGVRLLVRLESSEARLFSRQGREITRQYPSLAAALA